MKAVSVSHLSKTYIGGKKAVDGISFTLEPGEVFGFLGPNGAGKTTAVKLLSGMLSPTGGTCRVFDIDPANKPEQLHQYAGVVTEHAQMYDHLTGIQNLLFYGTLFGMTAGDSDRRAQDLLEQLDLTDAKDRKLETYSTGMRQRLSLARAMIHHPKILFLDEPTSGLDPESVLHVNAMIKKLAEHEGTTIFLCTHQLRYAQEICNSYGLIDNGKLLAAGTIEKLRSMVFSGLTARIETDHFPQDLPSVKVAERQYDIQVKSKDEIASVIKRIVEAGGNVYQASARQLSLEEIYFSLLDKQSVSSTGTESDRNG